MRSCPNCGEAAPLAFCPRCGQAQREPRGPLVEMAGEFLSQLFSIDGRHLRTLGYLAIPGRLTRRHLEGRRASQATPIRLYLATSLLFFLVVGLQAPDADRFNVYVDDVLVGREAPAKGLGNLQLMKLDRSSALGRKLAPGFDAKVETLRTMPAQVLLDRLFERLERTIPTTLIAVVPFVALGLTLLQFRQPFFYVDHLVFALHVHSFLFVLLVGVRLLNVVLLDRFVSSIAGYALAYFVVMPVYLVLAARRVYRQSWARTLAKCALLAACYAAILVPVLLFTLFVVLRGL